MKKKRNVILGVLTAGLLLTGCGKNGADIELDPDKPVAISIWHYYNGAQKNAFDQMINEFNDTVGRQQGILVESHNKGDVKQLEESVLNSIQKEIGSDEIPNIFASYADTAFSVEKAGFLADIGQYMTEKEIEEYVDSYIEEGRIGKGNELRLFPVGKSTEILMLNKTDWDEFAKASGATEKDLMTKEGLVLTAQKYYEWTDSMTPDIANDGRAFYGRDSMANLFLIGSMQLGVEMFQVENAEVTLQFDQKVMRKIWDCYYVPYIKGYFSSYGRFRADDVKIGEIICYVGSSTSASYFPNSVETENESYPIEVSVLDVPVFEGGEKIAVQQGAGMGVIKGTKEEEFASVEFLKWFTQVDRNLAFSAGSGYLPVKKEANNIELLNQVAENDETLGESDALLMSFQIASTSKMYTSKTFAGAREARSILEYQLSDKAAADREEVEKRLMAGISLEEAAAPYISEKSFEAWYQELVELLSNAVRDGGE